MVALRVSDPAGAPICVQLDSLVDPAGSAWVTSMAGDLGPFCVSCAQRVSVGIGYGLFVLPSNDQPLPFPFPTTLEVVAGTRDCATLLRAATGTPLRLRIGGLFSPQVAAPFRSSAVSDGDPPEHGVPA